MRTDGNSYGNLTTLKTMIDISGTSDDTKLLQSLEMSSRSIDSYCNRKFYSTTETKQYRGSSRTLLLYDDLLSVTTLTTLKDDRSTDKTWATTDYELFPLGDTVYPKEWIELADNTTAGSFSNNTKRGVQIVGVWGYGNGNTTTPYQSTTTLNDGDFDSSETTFTAASGSSLNIGETILINSEQMYITGISSNTITVQRAMNGTSGSSHSNGSTIYVYTYHQQIVNATYLQAGRIAKRWQTAYATTLGTQEMSPYEVSVGVDADVRRLIDPFKTQRIA